MEPIAQAPDGRTQYQLPNGMRLVLNPRRQAKKAIQRSENLSPRQYRKLKKAMKRARQNDTAQESATA